MELETLTETKHQELMSLMNPLIDFMNENNYSFFLVAGKDGTCTRHLMGDYNAIHGMIGGLAEKHKQLNAMLKDISKVQTGINCNCSNEQKNGETKVFCCNECGLPTEDFWRK